MTRRRPRSVRPPARGAVAAMLVVGVALVGCGGATAPADVAPSTSASPSAAAGSPAASSCGRVATLDEVPPLHPSVDGYPTAVVTISAPDRTCDLRMAVRHADTPERRAHGLMEVPDLPDGTGMLFTYPDVEGDRTGGYWMANTLVPLDIAYIGGDGTIVDIVAMDPCDQAALEDGERCPTYPPDAAYRLTLEVPQGWYARAGVTEGWSVSVSS